MKKKMKVVKLITSLTIENGIIKGMETENIYLSGKLDLKTKYSATKGDRLYIDSFVKIPRARIRNWGSDLDIKIVRDPNKATIKVFPSSSNDFHIPIISRFFIKINFNIASDILDPNFKKVIDYKYEYYTNNDNNISIFDKFDFDTNFMYTIKSYIDYNNLVNKTVGGHSSESLIDAICLQGNILTKDDYYSLKDMLNSNNNKDVGVAMSIMSNCNYRESLHFLYYLFKNCM